MQEIGLGTHSKIREKILLRNGNNPEPQKKYKIRNCKENLI